MFTLLLTCTATVESVHNIIIIWVRSAFIACSQPLAGHENESEKRPRQVSSKVNIRLIRNHKAYQGRGEGMGGEGGIWRAGEGEGDDDDDDKFMLNVLRCHLTY